MKNLDAFVIGLRYYRTERTIQFIAMLKSRKESEMIRAVRKRGNNHLIQMEFDIKKII